MKNLLLLLCLTLWAVCGNAQVNLVPNPSFELYDTCPNSSSQIQFAIGWSSFRGSPDYFNTCATTFATIPNNQVGYQEPLSGNGYAGIWGYASWGFYREIIGAQLTTPLIIGQKYYVSFETVLSNQALGYGSCAIDKIGAKFSTIPFSLTNPVPINNSAQLYSSSVITDTLNWKRIKGSFVADSAYSFIMLGNFFDDAHTDTSQIGGQSNCDCYYMIENVCVSTDSSYSYNYTYTGIEENSTQPTISIYPNPTIDYINIGFTYLNEPYTVTIYDVLGREVFFKEKIIQPLEHIPIDNINSNILIIQITYKNKLINYKIIKIKQ